jgi:hypothetical protein
VLGDNVNTLVCNGETDAELVINKLLEMAGKLVVNTFFDVKETEEDSMGEVWATGLTLAGED